jgi:hypothetical protein
VKRAEKKGYVLYWWKKEKKKSEEGRQIDRTEQKMMLMR